MLHSAFAKIMPAGSRACISCGAPAAAFCARCGVAPYCGQRCQRKDWGERHRDVCHNLARTGQELDVAIKGVEPAASIPPPPLLRRPKSPANREPFPKKDDDNHSDKGSNKKFTSPNQNEGQKPQRLPRSNESNGNDRNFNNGNDRSFNKSERNVDKSDRSFNKNDRSSNTNERFNKNERNFDKSERTNERNYDRQGHRNGPRNDTAGRRPPLRHEAKDEDDWGPSKASTPQAKPQESQPTPSPKRDPIPESKPGPLKETVIVNPVPVSSVTPVKKMVPKNYLLETLPIGSTVLVTVENSHTECRIKSGLVCVHMHETAQQDYEALLQLNQAKDIQPAIGELFAYFEPSEEAWYRARLVSPTLAALIDAARIAPLAAQAKTSTLADDYIAKPEFCCVLLADSVKVGDNLNCTVLSKTPLGYKVSITNIENGANIGEGEITRWIPEIELPKPVENAQAPVQIPEVERPSLVSGSKVFIVHAEAPDKVIVRGAGQITNTIFETALQLANGSAAPLKEPPQQGDVVLAKFTDGLKYRALVIRTNSKAKKYKLEYIDFGNTHIATLEDLYTCPSEIQVSEVPVVSTSVKVNRQALTEKAVEYLLSLRDNDVEVKVTSPDGLEIKNGGECTLINTKNNENINKKLEELSTPEWKKVEQTTGNVTDIQTVMFSEVEYLGLPPNGCELEILDFSTIDAKTVNGYQKGHAHAKFVFGQLTDKMAEYCNSPLGKEPYMPKQEELCIAQCPPYPQWFRAVVLEAIAGQPARVLYIDYGNVELLAPEHMRRITRDFVTGIPVLAATIEIRGFPENPTELQLAKALQHMQVNDEGRGVLKVSRCEKQDEGMYIVDAPALIEEVMK